MRPLRGSCRLLKFTGTGFAQPKPAREHDGSERVQVFPRIKGKAAQPLGGGVAHLTGDPAVGNLMDDDRVEERDNQQHESGRISK